jgi:molybdenum cofactor biosynthesis protein B
MVHRAVPPVSVNIAVLSNADLAAAEVVAMESAVADRATQAGHKIVAFSTVKNSEVAIRSELVGWLADPEIDVVIVVGEGDAVGRSLKPMIDQSLPGFPDLLRKLASEAIGKGALLSVAEAARCGTTFVFVLPGNEQAVAAAMDKVVLPQLDPRTKPRNLIAAMPRLRDAVTHDVTRVDVTKIESSRPSEQVITAVNNARLESARVASAKTDTEKTRVGIDVKKIEESRLDSVPTPVAFEKTESGAGPAPKLPAMPSGRAEPVKKDNGAPTRARSRTGANVIVRKVEDTTKPIDLERLEREIAASKDDDATKSAPAAPSIEHTRPTLKPLPSIIAKPIPAPVSIPDELDDDHTKPMDLSQPTRGPAKKLSEQTQTNITKPTEITKPMDLSRLPKLPPGADQTALDDDAIAPPPIARPTPVPTALAPEPQSEIGRIQLKQVPSRATPPPIVEIQAPQASDSAETNPAASTEPASRATPAPANVAGGASPSTFAEALNAAASAGSTGPASRGISKGATSEGAATSRAIPTPPSRNAGAGWTSIGSTDAAPASRSRGAGSASTGKTSSDETPTSRATPTPAQSRGVGSASTRAGSASPGTTSSDEAPTSRATPASTRPAASTGAVSTGAASRGAGSGSTGAGSTGAA